MHSCTVSTPLKKFSTVVVVYTHHNSAVFILIDTNYCQVDISSKQEIFVQQFVHMTSGGD